MALEEAFFVLHPEVLDWKEQIMLSAQKTVPVLWCYNLVLINYVGIYPGWRGFHLRDLSQHMKSGIKIREQVK